MEVLITYQEMNFENSYSEQNRITPEESTLQWLNVTQRISSIHSAQIGNQINSFKQI